MYKATVQQGADFLCYLFSSGVKYGYVAGARSALSAILPTTEGKTFGNQEVVKRVLKGTFKLRPSFPRQVVTYDADTVLDYMMSLPPNSELMLETLTLKLSTLLCFLSGSRPQLLTALDLDQHYRDPKGYNYVFNVGKILKTSRPGRQMKPVELRSFPHDDKLCIVNLLDVYIRRTELVRENSCADMIGKPLIISFKAPYLPVGTATASRYVKTFLFLGLAGIDITVFTAHSTRAASTSKGNNLGLAFRDIAKAAGWRKESTFQNFYKKTICTNLGSTILNGYSKKCIY